MDDRRTAIRTLLLAVASFAAFRGALFVFDYVGMHLVPRDLGVCRPQWDPFGAEHPFWNGFFRWDGGWYRNIVLNGYRYRPGAPSSVAFYPLFPYLARWLGVVLGSPFAAGLVISNLATIGGLYYLLRLGQDRFDLAVAERAAVLLLVFPTSFFLSAFYTEGLFFVFAAGSMFYFYRGRYVTSGALGGLSMLARSSGLVLFLALAADLAFSLYKKRTPFRWQMLGLFLIPLALALFMAFLNHEVGDPLAFMKVMSNWGRVRSLPWVPLIDALKKLTPLLPEHFDDAQEIVDALTAIGFLAIGVAMVREKYPVAMSVMVLAGVLMPLSTYVLASMGRYVLALFPAFYFLGKKSKEHPHLERFLLFASAFFLALYGIRFIRCGFAG
ncbi:MAG TPA: mannosyltransferase family protein [Polyangiaceae bacterium]|nr:mannosyltransferase family protein [Polyangiaceae bacterium]